MSCNCCPSHLCRVEEPSAGSADRTQLLTITQSSTVDHEAVAGCLQLLISPSKDKLRLQACMWSPSPFAWCCGDRSGYLLFAQTRGFEFLLFPMEGMDSVNKSRKIRVNVLSASALASIRKEALCTLLLKSCLHSQAEIFHLYLQSLCVRKESWEWPVSEEVFSNMVELKNEGLSPCQWESRSCRNVLERWLQRNRCESFPQLMVACTDDCQHRAGLAACQPLRQGRVCCKSHLLGGRRSGIPEVGGGMGGMWDLPDMLKYKQSKSELYSLESYTDREILMSPRLEDGSRKGTTAMCASGCMLREALKFGLFRVRGKLEAGTVVWTPELLPTYHGVSVSFKVRAWGGGSVCVWTCFPVACCACHPSQPCDTAELSALAVFTRTGHLTVCYCCQMCLVYETNQMFFFSLSVPFFQSFFLNSAERRVLWHWPVAWQTWYTTSDRDYSGWDWKQICLNWFSRWLNTLKFFCTFEASETV